MASQISIPVLDGPGTAQLVSVGFKKKEIFFTIRGRDAFSAQRIYAQIERAHPASGENEWRLGGTFRMGPYVLSVPFDCLAYDSKNRKGNFFVSSSLVVEHPICGHLIYSNTRFCHVCGKDKSDMG